MPVGFPLDSIAKPAVLPRFGQLTSRQQALAAALQLPEGVEYTLEDVRAAFKASFRMTKGAGGVAPTTAESWLDNFYIPLAKRVMAALPEKPERLDLARFLESMLPKLLGWDYVTLAEEVETIAQEMAVQARATSSS